METKTITEANLIIKNAVENKQVIKIFNSNKKGFFLLTTNDGNLIGDLPGDISDRYYIKIHKTEFLVNDVTINQLINGYKRIPRVLLTFLGRNEENIKNDAISLFGEFDEYITISRDNDKLSNSNSVEVSKMVEELRLHLILQENSYKPNHNPEIWDITLIANGGTTAQQIPVVKELFSSYYDTEEYYDGWSYMCNIMEITRDKEVIYY